MTVSKSHPKLFWDDIMVILKSKSRKKVHGMSGKAHILFFQCNAAGVQLTHKSLNALSKELLNSYRLISAILYAFRKFHMEQQPNIRKHEYSSEQC